MNKIVIAAAAFVAGLGGTTAVFAVRAKPAPLAVAADSLSQADSAKADSTAGHAADSSDASPTDAPAGVPAADSVRATATPATPATGHAVPAVPSAAPTAAAASAARAAPAIPARAASDSALRNTTYRQLARIYSAMKPTEAAEVLSHIGDEDVVGILTKFGTRQAAQILGAMPRERAAGLSQRLLDASSPPRVAP